MRKFFKKIILITVVFNLSCCFAMLKKKKVYPEQVTHTCIGKDVDIKEDDVRDAIFTAMDNDCVNCLKNIIPKHKDRLKKPYVNKNNELEAFLIYAFRGENSNICDLISKYYSNHHSDSNKIDCIKIVLSDSIDNFEKLRVVIKHFKKDIVNCDSCDNIVKEALQNAANKKKYDAHYYLNVELSLSEDDSKGFNDIDDEHYFSSCCEDACACFCAPFAMLACFPFYLVKEFCVC